MTAQGLGNLIKHLLTYELLHRLFVKVKKYQLLTELWEPLKEKYLAEIQPTEEERVIVIDFLGCTKKGPVSKLKLKTFHDLVKNLGSTFRSFSATCTRNGIVFDLYKEKKH